MEHGVFALRRIWGDESHDSWEREEGPWLFNDASRELRLLSVDKIPDVLAELSKEASVPRREFKENGGST